MSPLRPMTSTPSSFAAPARGIFSLGDHDSEVDDFVVITGKNNADDILADVVDVAFHRGEQHFALGLLVAGALFFLLHVGEEIGD